MLSRPPWACGLKRDLIRRHNQKVESRPPWACGLKHSTGTTKRAISVAPPVGVWIETGLYKAGFKRHTVAPPVGVWIETGSYFAIYQSRFVAPPVGVWIETIY